MRSLRRVSGIQGDGQWVGKIDCNNGRKPGLEYLGKGRKTQGQRLRFYHLLHI